MHGLTTLFNYLRQQEFAVLAFLSNACYSMQLKHKADGPDLEIGQ
jgi:hypothetical protein